MGIVQITNFEQGTLLWNSNELKDNLLPVEIKSKWYKEKKNVSLNSEINLVGNTQNIKLSESIWIDDYKEIDVYEYAPKIFKTIRNNYGITRNHF